MSTESALPTRKLGRTGFALPVLGIGTNAFGTRADAKTSREIIHRALDYGPVFVDTANVYTKGQSETILGQAIASHRSEVVLATKAGMSMGPGPNDRGSSRSHLMREVEASLQRLKTDYIDLFWVHTYDPSVAPDETLRTLQDLQRSGKVRYLGASNYLSWELMKSLDVSAARGMPRFEAVQISYSLIDRTPEREMSSLCVQEDLSIVTYFPLASGILTGKYLPGQAPRPGTRAAMDARFAQRLNADHLNLAQEVAAIARELQATAAQVAIAWLLTRPAVSSVIAGATRIEQLQDNIGGAHLKLPAEAVARLDEISAPSVYGQPFGVFRLS